MEPQFPKGRHSSGKHRFVREFRMRRRTPGEYSAEHRRHSRAPSEEMHPSLPRVAFCVTCFGCAQTEFAVQRENGLFHIFLFHDERNV